MNRSFSPTSAGSPRVQPLWMDWVEEVLKGRMGQGQSTQWATDAAVITP